MSERHIRAVQRMRRSFTDQTEYEVLCIIATDTGRDDSPTFTSIREIADRAGCHYNTVTTKLRSLRDQGLIDIQKRGRSDVYILLFDCGTPAHCDNQDPIVTNDCDNHNELSQRLSQIEGQLSQLSQRLSQLEALIVTMNQTAIVTEVVEDKEVEEEDIYISPQTPLIVTDPEPIAQLKTALAQATKTPFWEKTHEEYDEAAHMLFGWDATPGQVANFRQWWDTNGNYAGSPALKSLITEWRNYISGIARASPNGQHDPPQTAREIAAAALREMRHGNG